MAKGSAGLALAAGAVGIVGLAVVWAIWGRSDVSVPEPVPLVQATSPAAAPEAAAPEIAAPEIAGAEAAATAALEAAAAVSADPATPAPDAGLPLEAPRFDVVRVDAGGMATIAGTAPPGAAVLLRLDGVEVARMSADAAGQFATLLTLPPSDLPRLLSLAVILPDGSGLPGPDTVALAPVAAPEMQVAEAAASEVAGGSQVAVAPDAPAASASAPAALLLTPEGVTVLQAGAVPADASAPAAPSPDAPLPILIDSIAYGAAGEVLLGGKAAPGGALRIYLDDAPVAEALTDASGGWQARLEEVAGGLHVLRADQIDAGGKVLSRFETPFKRDLPAPMPPETAAVTAEAVVPAGEAPVAAPEVASAPAPAPADAAPVIAPAPITITVQPGLTLWAIARQNFGAGIMYVQVFEANRDKIKDPDLIYPGQVFTVPKP